MFCPKCGKELPNDIKFCTGCGENVSSVAAAQEYDGRPAKEPSTLGPFLLGLILGIIGVIIAVIVYNGNDGPYTKNPTTHALVWSLIGMFIWIPILFAIMIPFIFV